MPIINVKLLETGVSDEQKIEIIQKMTDVLTDVLNKKPETTHVVIEEINPANWGLSGKPLNAQ